MPAYHETFRKSEKVRIKDKEILRKFQKEWRGRHHNLNDKQIGYGGKLAVVKSAGYYHGGSVLIELEHVPGIWHEELLEEPIPEGKQFIPAIDYYSIIYESYDRILLKGKNGEEYRVEPEYFIGQACVEIMKEIAKQRTKEGFEYRFALSGIYRKFKSRRKLIISNCMIHYGRDYVKLENIRTIDIFSYPNKKKRISITFYHKTIKHKNGYNISSFWGFSQDQINEIDKILQRQMDFYPNIKYQMITK